MRIIQIVGPTASGKTRFAMNLAKECDSEIINVDSMQVYREISVGTDKPTAAQQAEVVFSCIDLIPLGPPLDAAAFAQFADERIEYLTSVDKIPILCGGTGLYHKVIRYGLIEAPSRDDDFRARLRAERDLLGQDAIYARLQALDREAASRIHPHDWVRIERALEVFATTGQPLSAAQDSHGFSRARYESLCFGCWRPRSDLYDLIDVRLESMWESGILEETERMLGLGLDPEQLPLKALGYRQAALYLNGKLTSNEALEMAKNDTHHFAKRQMTWFKADKSVIWLNMSNVDSKVVEKLSRAIRAFYAGVSPDWNEIPIVDLSSL